MALSRLEQIQRDVLSDDLDIRGRAMQELYLWSKKEPGIHAAALAIFRTNLEHEHQYWPAMSAVRGIALLAGPAEGRLALRKLIDHPDARLASQAAMMMNDPIHVPDLLALIERRADVEIQTAAIRTLGRARDPSAFAAIVKRLDDPALRPHAIEALGDLGDARAIPSLLPLLEDRTAAWEIDNHGPMLYVRDLARTAIDHLRAPPGANDGSHASTAPTPPGNAALAPPPLPTNRMRRNWLAYVPLAAAVAELGWAFGVIVLIMASAGKLSQTRTQTHTLDVIAMLPALAGVLIGAYVIVRRRTRRLVESGCLWIGITACAALMYPFAWELFH